MYISNPETTWLMISDSIFLGLDFSFPKLYNRRRHLQLFQPKVSPILVFKTLLSL